jgi:hypothetical protein
LKPYEEAWQIETPVTSGNDSKKRMPSALGLRGAIAPLPLLPFFLEKPIIFMLIV